MRPIVSLLVSLALPGLTFAAEAPLTTKQRCLLESAERAPDDTRAAELRLGCGLADPDSRQRNEDALRNRLALEESTQFNPFVMTPHRRNYLLPATHWSNPQWNDPDRQDAPIDHLEAKFQVSLKLPLKTGLWRDSTLYGALTMQSWWQVYNQELSSPFRETNYSPELFMATPASGRFAGLDLELVSWGYQHQSNGQDVPVSRSWDRLFVNFIFKWEDYYLSLRPWWRLPEDDKRYPGDRKGDDNPDIEHYMGHFELTVARPFGNHVAELMWRNNLRSDNRGAGQLDYSFPISSRIKGLLQVFSGYGESLINYNDYETRVGVGILFTDTL